MMSQEVSLSVIDYRTITSWYDRLFGKGKEPTNEDRMTYQKLIIMALAYGEELQQQIDDPKDRKI